MKISLRKANALQQNINEALRGIKYNLTIEINEFEDVAQKIEAAQKEVLDNAGRASDLNTALYTIRALVGQANAVEINGILTQIALLEKQIQVNNLLTTGPKLINAGVIVGKLDKIRKGTESESSRLYGRTSEVTTGVFDEHFTKQFKQASLNLKKEKQKLQDRVLELNIRTEIELIDEAVAILTREGLI